MRALALDFLLTVEGESIKGRLILVGETPYLLMMNYLSVNYDENLYAGFINSFKLI